MMRFISEPHRGGQHLQTSLRGSAATPTDGRTVPLVSASASLKDSTIALSLVNADPWDASHPCNVTVTLDSGAFTGAQSGRVLTARTARDQNAPADPARIAPGALKVTLPPVSVAMVELRQ